MPEPRIRPAARGLVVTPDHHVLLVRFEFPAGTRWALPGGGLDAGEDHVAALRRELREEVGLVDVTIGPHVWTREHLIPFMDVDFNCYHRADDGVIVEIQDRHYFRQKDARALIARAATDRFSLFEDPLFRGAVRGAMDFTLRPASPARGKGANAGVEADHDGRPFAIPPNMGSRAE